jgi:oligopeptidase B
VRKKLGDKKALEEVILDGNKLAKGSKYFLLLDPKASDSGTYLAYAVDTKGDGTYKIAIKDLSSGKTLKDVIEATSGEFVWAAEGQGLLYVRRNDKDHRGQWV